MAQATWRLKPRFPRWVAAGVLFTTVAGVIWPVEGLLGDGWCSPQEKALEMRMFQAMMPAGSVEKHNENVGLLGRFGI